jgi:hypothetical protein
MKSGTFTDLLCRPPDKGAVTPAYAGGTGVGFFGRAVCVPKTNPPLAALASPLVRGAA